MDDIWRVNWERDKRIGEEIDGRILDVQKILGEDPNKRCQHCGQQAVILGHDAECPLRRIDPNMLRKGQEDAAIELRKNCNKQRIFRTDQKRWSGSPPMQPTMVRKRVSKNRGPGRELRKCFVCITQTLFENGKCQKCEHSQRCALQLPYCKACWPRQHAEEEMAQLRQVAAARKKKKK